MQVKNPILPGCYPDPSICRVGDDYYLVLSTFEYLPGLPVFHSRDLVNWEQIGHVIDRPGMLEFDGIGSSGGLFAPTIRFNPKDHKFYVVCTLVDRGVNERQGQPAGNFIVTAENPAGPWSDPIWLDKPGIDPSLFFDEATGKIWLHGTRLADPGEWFHQTEVWLQELDPATLQPIGEEYILWTGAVRGAVWCEGPHIYRIGDYYYLLTAEGGTEFHHAISVARAKEVTGPYEGNKCNPIFTHRTLGRAWPIMGVGHADLFPFGSASFANPTPSVEGTAGSSRNQGAHESEASRRSVAAPQPADSPYTNPISQVQTTPDNPTGGWFAVLLGMRLYGGYHYNLGRETFLVPVTWEDDWPVFAPGIGHIPDTVAVPDASVEEEQDSVSKPRPRSALVKPADLRWSALRALPTEIAMPDGDAWRIPLRSSKLSEPSIPAFLGIRQTAQNCRLEVKIDLSELEPDDWAGIAIRQSEKDYAAVMASPSAKDSEVFDVHTHVIEKGTPKEREAGLDCLSFGTVNLNPNAGGNSRELTFIVDVVGQDYNCFVDAGQGELYPCGTIDGRTLDTAAAGGFLGLWLGVYAVTENPAPAERSITATVKYQPEA